MRAAGPTVNEILWTAIASESAGLVGSGLDETNAILYALALGRKKLIWSKFASHSLASVTRGVTDKTEAVAEMYLYV
jgi:hypothetical protein